MESIISATISAYSTFITMKSLLLQSIIAKKTAYFAVVNGKSYATIFAILAFRLLLFAD
jgi:ABC-type enterochelin transport system permease subunit